MVKNTKKKSIKKRKQRAGGPRFSIQKKSPESNTSVSNNKTRKKKKVQFNEPDKLEEKYEDEPRDSNEFYCENTKRKTLDEILHDEAEEQGITNEKQINAYVEEQKTERKKKQKRIKKNKKEILGIANEKFIKQQEKDKKQKILDDFIKNYNNKEN